MKKENPYREWTTGRLRKHQKLIEEELHSLIRGGQEADLFLDLHSLPECDIFTNYLRSVGSGFGGYDSLVLFEPSLYIYQHACETHGSTSREFHSSTGIEKKERAIENDYPKAREQLMKLRNGEMFGKDYTTDYFISVEKRAIRAELISPQESLCHKPEEE